MTAREWIDVIVARVRLLWRDDAWHDAELVAPDVEAVPLEVGVRVLRRFEHRAGNAWPPSLAEYLSALHTEPIDTPALPDLPAPKLTEEERQLVIRTAYEAMPDGPLKEKLLARMAK